MRRLCEAGGNDGCEANEGEMAFGAKSFGGDAILKMDLACILVVI